LDGILGFLADLDTVGKSVFDDTSYNSLRKFKLGWGFSARTSEPRLPRPGARSPLYLAVVSQPAQLGVIVSSRGHRGPQTPHAASAQSWGTDATHAHILGLDKLLGAVVRALAAQATLLDSTKWRHFG